MNGKRSICLALLLAVLLCLAACGEQQTPDTPTPPNPDQGTEGPGNTQNQPSDPVGPDKPAPEDPNKSDTPAVPDPPVVEPEPPAVVYTSASPADLVLITGSGDQAQEHVLTLGNFSWVYQDYKGDTETNQVQGVVITEAGVVDLGSLSLSALSSVTLRMPEGITAVRQSLLNADGTLVKETEGDEGFLSADPGTYLYQLQATYSSGSQVQYMARITLTE